MLLFDPINVNLIYRMALQQCQGTDLYTIWRGQCKELSFILYRRPIPKRSKCSHKF